MSLNNRCSNPVQPDRIGRLRLQRHALVLRRAKTGGLSPTQTLSSLPADFTERGSTCFALGKENGELTPVGRFPTEAIPRSFTSVRTAPSCTPPDSVRGSWRRTG